MCIQKLAILFGRTILIALLFPFAIMAQTSFERWCEGSTAWNMYYPTPRIIYGIDAISDNEVWFVGGDMFWDPFAFHYKDGIWTLERDGPPFPYDSMYDVEILSPTDGWAVGSDGVMYHYDGNSWTEMSRVTSLSLFDVELLSKTDGWAMGGTFRWGGNSVILHYDGTAWTIFQENVGSGGWIQALDMVTPTDGWATDDEGYVYHYNGTKWSSVGRPTSKGLYGLDMVAANDGWAVGDDGVILHYDGTNWSSILDGSEIDFTDITMVSAEEGWAIGSEGDFFSTSSVIMHYDGRSWSRVTNPMPSRLFSAIYMQSPTNGWIGGSDGTVLHYDGSTWTPDSKLTRPATQLRAVDILSSTDVWAVGGWSDFLGYAQDENIIHFDGTVWTDFSVSNVGLNGIDMVSSDDGWAVGSTILHYDGEWHDVGNPTAKTLQDISMLSSTEGWAVGSDGTILHYNGSIWATVSSPTTADFYGIEMLSSTGWILGHVSNATVFLKYDGATWSIEQLVQDVSLSSFDMLTETSGWAVGDDGNIFQYNATEAFGRRLSAQLALT